MTQTHDDNQARPELADLLPPGDSEVQALPYEHDILPPSEERAQLTDDDRAAIAEHIDGVMEAAAQIGADTMPPHLRDEYERAFASSRMVRGAVAATGIGHALHELMPSSGPAGVGSLPAPMQRLHPVARVLMGVVVLGIATAMQRKVVLNAAGHTGAGANPAGNAGGAGGGVGVQNGPHNAYIRGGGQGG